MELFASVELILQHSRRHVGAKMATAAARINSTIANEPGNSTRGAAAPLPVIARLSLEGDRREYRPADVTAPDGSTATVARVQNTSPLEWLASRSRDPLQPYQLETGRLVVRDFHRARQSSIRVANVSAGALYRTADMMKQSKDWDGRGAASKQPRAYGVSDARLDAIRRLGSLLAHVGAVSFHLLERVLSDEVGLAALTAELGEDQKYVSRRFREALDSAASFYQLAPKGYVSHPGREQ